MINESPNTIRACKPLPRAYSAFTLPAYGWLDQRLTASDRGGAFTGTRLTTIVERYPSSAASLEATRRRVPQILPATMVLRPTIRDPRVWMHNCMSRTSVTARRSPSRLRTSRFAPSSRRARNLIAYSWRKSCAQALTSEVHRLLARILLLSLGQLPLTTLSGQ